MIGRLSKVLFLGLLASSCASNNEEEACESCALEVDSLALSEEKAPVVSDELMKKYIDPKLVPEAEVFEDPSISYPEVSFGDNRFEILTYEGVFTRAEVHAEGGTFWFEPYNYWDDDLELEVKSEYQMNMTFDLNKDQINYLDFTELNAETNNIQWDFFENLFGITFYLDENQNNRPLKFENLGKTDWDG